MPDRNITMLLWSFPIALGVHVFEEFAFPGGLRQWIRDYKPNRLKSNFYYVIINAAAIVGAAIIALMARSLVGYLLFLYSVGIMTGNAASHIRGTYQLKRYCPGVVSGGLLFVPLLVIGYWYFLKTGMVGFASATPALCIGNIVGYRLFGVDIRQTDLIRRA